jgi:hypothetical protein
MTNPLLHAPYGIRRDSSPITIYLFNNLKIAINQYFSDQKITLTFKPKRYTPAEFLLVVLYAQIKNISTADASEQLNDACKECILHYYKKAPKIFADKKRHRRYIPHQTDVNKFLRCLSEKDIMNLQLVFLDRFNREIMNSLGGKRTWKIIADNTKYPYYGTLDPIKHIQNHKLPGTKHAWMFQGISALSGTIQIYLNFYSLTKGVYRSKDIPKEIDWLKFQDIRLSELLVDREFYRTTLVKDCKTRKIPILFPAKKYPGVRTKMVNFLDGNKKLVSTYLFSHGSNPNSLGQCAVMSLVIIGHNNQDPYEIRRNYQLGKWSLAKALKNLAGFLTTIKSWKNHLKFGYFLSKEYKHRWFTETGFAKINSIHDSNRSAKWKIKLLTLTMDGWIYNHWQWVRERIRFERKINSRYMTFKRFLRDIEHVLQRFIIQNGILRKN